MWYVFLFCYEPNFCFQVCPLSEQEVSDVEVTFETKQNDQFCILAVVAQRGSSDRGHRSKAGRAAAKIRMIQVLPWNTGGITSTDPTQICEDILIEVSQWKVQIKKMAYAHFLASV